MSDCSPPRIDPEAAALVLREQERFGQDLHDTLGPQLTAISMLAASLHDRLRMHDASETELAAKLLSRIEQAKADVRAFAKGLLPVECDAEGLMSALAELAEETEASHGVVCHLECGTPATIADNFTATRLYRIAKEAVHNAVKHGQASEILISLDNADAITLRVRDDGVGISPAFAKNRGSGMQIMRHRCEVVGGRFEVYSGDGDGTTVTCTIETGGASCRIEPV